MINYKQIEVKGFLVETALRPCPWCKKTPNLWMPLDQEGSSEEQTWVWTISCKCNVSCEAKTSIRNTTKTNLTRFLDKIDEFFDRWNADNPIKAYEKKVLDLRMIPTLGMR